MNPLKIYWKPESLESTDLSQINSPPIGKPDPSMPRHEGMIRPRVHQKGQVGPTCVYYAARKLAPHFGKAEPYHMMRCNEKMLSLFRRVIAMTQIIQDAPWEEAAKSYMTASVIACTGFNIHFPREALWLSIMNFLMPFQTTGASQPVVIEDKKFLDTVYQCSNNFLRRFGAFSLRLMLCRMNLVPLDWVPYEGPKALVSALRTNLYIWCHGDFGSHVYEPLQVIQVTPRFGPIYGGKIRDIKAIPKGYLTLHAIVVIGVRERKFMEGDVYYVDPRDESGPQVAPKIYHISLKDFFYRIKDSFGNSPMRHEVREFAWVGNPAVFLA